MQLDDLGLVGEELGHRGGGVDTVLVTVKADGNGVKAV